MSLTEKSGTEARRKKMEEKEVGWGEGKEEGFSVLLFITNRGVYNRRKRQEKLNWCWSGEGRKEKEKPFKEIFRETVCFINNSCSGRIYIEGILINKSEWFRDTYWQWFKSRGWTAHRLQISREVGYVFKILSVVKGQALWEDLGGGAKPRLNFSDYLL